MLCAQLCFDANLSEARDTERNECRLTSFVWVKMLLENELKSNIPLVTQGIALGPKIEGIQFNYRATGTTDLDQINPGRVKNNSQRARKPQDSMPDIPVVKYWLLFVRSLALEP